MKHLLARLGREQRGAVAMEYGLIGGAIALAIWAALAGLGYVLNPKENPGCGVDATLRTPKSEQA